MEDKQKVYQPSDETAAAAHITSRQSYDDLYTQSLNEPDAFWSQQAGQLLDWHEKCSGPVCRYVCAGPHSRSLALTGA